MLLILKFANILQSRKTGMMQRVPLTLDQAKTIRQQYLFLIGKRYDVSDNTVVISDIAISPFDQANKKRFVLFYILTNDAEQALYEDYKGLLFDVLVIAKNGDMDILYENIDAWLQKNDIAHVKSL